MKKIILTIILLCFMIITINADEISDIASKNIGKFVNIYLINYNRPYDQGTIFGTIIEVNEKILVIKVYLHNPNGPNKIGKLFIKINQISAIGIADN